MTHELLLINLALQGGPVPVDEVRALLQKISVLPSFYEVEDDDYSRWTEHGLRRDLFKNSFGVARAYADLTKVSAEAFFWAYQVVGYKDWANTDPDWRFMADPSAQAPVIRTLVSYTGKVDAFVLRERLYTLYWRTFVDSRDFGPSPWKKSGSTYYLKPGELPVSGVKFYVKVPPLEELKKLPRML